MKKIRIIILMCVFGLIISSCNKKELQPESEKYRVYSALITQSGENAPEVVVLENTLGEIYWYWSSYGFYAGRLDDAFTENKTWLYIENNNAVVNRFDRDIVVINTSISDVNTDGVLREPTSIEIRVYD